MIDAILFNDEIELLYSRLEYLRDFIDTTVIIESDRTFSGRSKQLLASQNLETLKTKTPREIIVRKVLGNADSLDSWDFEAETRRQLISFLKEKFPLERIIFSDLDEFPSFTQMTNLQRASRSGDNQSYSIPTPAYYRYVNLALPYEEDLKVAISFISSLAPDFNTARPSGESFPTIDGEPGAHLSYLGMDYKKISEKFSSFSHSELIGFDEIEKQLLDISDEYVIDHIGRFHEPSHGLMRYSSLNNLPSTNYRLAMLNSNYFREFIIPFKYSRLMASAIISFLRSNESKNTFLHKFTVSRIRGSEIRRLSQIGFLLVFSIVAIQFSKKIQTSFNRRIRIHFKF